MTSDGNVELNVWKNIELEEGDKMSYLYQINIVINEKEENIQIENEIEKVIEKYFENKDCLEIVGSQTIELDDKICEKCHGCGAWTSDQDNPEHVSSFSDGCRIDGVWLCDLCLPSDHPKAF